MSEPNPSPVRIGRCTFDRERLELRDGRGQPVRLRPQVVRVLEALLRRDGRVADRADLMAEVWPGDADNLAVLARAQVRVGRNAEALATMQRALALFPIRPAYIEHWRATVSWANRRWADAEAAADACVDLLPRHAGCHAMRALAAYEQGQRDEAATAVAAIRRLWPDALQASAAASSAVGDPAVGVRLAEVAEVLARSRPH